jgi:hypothetical protein
LGSQLDSEILYNTSVILSSACFAKINLEKKLTDSQFFEWLIGFSDAEGNFDIKKISNRPYAFEFRFRIGLHYDDKETLVKIQNRLNMGSIVDNNKTITNDNAFKLVKKSTITISKQEDVKKLITIFDKYGPLNTTKYLDYISWKKAFLLYLSLKEKSSTEKEIIKSEILKLKSNNNKGRTQYFKTDNTEIIIKSYWLLGFIEGESCFSVQKHVKSLTITPSFILNQTLDQMPVMEAIKNFLNKLVPDSLNTSESKVKLIVQEKNIYKPNAKPIIRLYVTDFSFIINYLIPFLDKLVFLSIKELDYLDWKTAIKFKTFKIHLNEEGSNIIKLLISRMNKNRKSTTKNNLNNDINYTEYNNIDARISNLLQGSIKELPMLIKGSTKPIPVWVYDKRELIKGSPFLSISECVKTLKHLGFTSHIKDIKDTGKLYKGKYTIYTKPL